MGWVWGRRDGRGVEREEREEMEGEEREKGIIVKKRGIRGEYHPPHTGTHCLRVVVGSWLMKMDDPAILEGGGGGGGGGGWGGKEHLEGLHDLVLEVMGLCQMEEEGGEGGRSVRDEGILDSLERDLGLYFVCFFVFIINIMISFYYVFLASCLF